MTPRAGKNLKDMILPDNMFNFDKTHTECVNCGKRMETSLNVLIKILCQTCIDERTTRRTKQ